LGRLTNQIAHQDLAAVTCRFEPGGEVHRRPEMVASSLVDLAEVQTHPKPRPGPRRVRQGALGLHIGEEERHRPRWTIRRR